MKVNYAYLKNNFPYSFDGLEAMIVFFFIENLTFDCFLLLRTFCMAQL